MWKWKLAAVIGMLCGMAGMTWGYAQQRSAPGFYELRIYKALPGKRDALAARFASRTAAIYARHGITNVGYWIPQDPEKSKTTLIYIISHASREAATKNWADFVADPEWKKVNADSNANGRIVAKTESVFMDPTDFSKLK